MSSIEVKWASTVLERAGCFSSVLDAVLTNFLVAWYTTVISLQHGCLRLRAYFRILLAGRMCSMPNM